MSTVATDRVADAARAAWAMDEALEALTVEDLQEPSAVIVAEHLEKLAAGLRARIQETGR